MAAAARPTAEITDAAVTDEVVVCVAGAVVTALIEVVGDVTVRDATPVTRDVARVVRDAAPVVSGGAAPRGTVGVSSSGGIVTC